MIMQVFEKELNEIFNLAHKINEKQFISAILLIDHLPGNGKPFISYLPNYEIWQLFKNLSGLKFTKREPAFKNSEIEVVFKLLAFCHLLEVDLYYSIIANMSKLILKGYYDVPELIGEMLGKKLTKMETLLSKLEKNGVNTQAIRNELCNYDIKLLRNKFSHGAYFIDNDKLVTTNFNEREIPKIFSISKIDNFLSLRISFLDAFNSIYNSWLDKYRDGELYEAEIFKDNSIEKFNIRFIGRFIIT